MEGTGAETLVPVRPSTWATVSVADAGFGLYSVVALTEADNPLVGIVLT